MIAFAAVTLTMQIARTTLDALDGVSIELAAHNASAKPATITFAHPEEYAIDVLHGSTVVWSTLRPIRAGVTFPPHVRTIPPGPSVLVVYVWNTIENDGATPSGGTYTVRARLLGEGVSPTAQTTIRFAMPTPISALAELKPGDEVTIAGRLDDDKLLLRDSTGAIALGRKLPNAPNAPIAVRGYVTLKTDGTRTFYVERWAPIE